MTKRFSAAALVLALFLLLAPVSATANHDDYRTYHAYTINEQVFARSLAASSDSEQIYASIYNALASLAGEVDLSLYHVSADEVFSICTRILNDHPEIFYLAQNKTTYWTNGKLEFKYLDTRENVELMRAELEAKIDEVLTSVITPGMTDPEKERAIHDYIVLHTAYDQKSVDKNNVPTESYTVYGTLIKNTAVCQGYAHTMKLLLDRLDIECLVLSSVDMNHAWNIVRLGNDYYHVDVTHDDPLPDRKNKVSYRYFNLSDRQIKAAGHHWDQSAGYPQCKAEDYTYMHEIDDPVVNEGYYYYSSIHDHCLYKIKTDGSSSKTQITTVRSLYPVIHDNWIYFSNYDHSGYLFKTRSSGGELTQLNRVHSTDLYFENGWLYFTNNESKQPERMQLSKEENIPVTSLNLDKQALYMLPGENTKLSAAISPAEATDKNVSWQSSKPGVAAVDQKGEVIAVGDGTATITAASAGGEKDYCTVNVTGAYQAFPEEKDIACNKEGWQIKFNQPLNKQTVNNENIYLIDYNKIKLTNSSLKLGKDRTEVILISNKDYEPGQTYCLFISKNIQAAAGGFLKNNTLLKFHTTPL